MAEFADHNVQLAMESFLERSEKKIKQIREQESIVDELEQEISRYLAKASQSSMDNPLSIRHTGLLHAVNDVERISDHADNIADLVQLAIEDNITFSDEATTGLKEMFELTRQTLETAIRAVREDDLSLVPEIKALEAKIDEMQELLRTAHIKRLKEGNCGTESGIVYLDLIGNLERIGDHAENLAHIPQGKL